MMVHTLTVHTQVVPAQYAFVLHTINPVTLDRGELVGVPAGGDPDLVLSSDHCLICVTSDHCLICVTWL